MRGKFGQQLEGLPVIMGVQTERDLGAGVDGLQVGTNAVLDTVPLLRKLIAGHDARVNLEHEEQRCFIECRHGRLPVGRQNTIRLQEIQQVRPKTSNPQATRWVGPNGELFALSSGLVVFV